MDTSYTTTIGVTKLTTYRGDSRMYQEGYDFMIEGYVIREGKHQRHHKVFIGVGQGNIGVRKELQAALRLYKRVSAVVSWYPDNWTIYEGSTRTSGRLLQFHWASEN